MDAFTNKIQALFNSEVEAMLNSFVAHLAEKGVVVEDGAVANFLQSTGAESSPPPKAKSAKKAETGGASPDAG